MKKIPVRRPLGVDWRLVRGLGQLHILNRTSLFLVVIVPILAAVWPVVQHTLAWYDGTLTHIQEKLEQLSETLSKEEGSSSAGSEASVSTRTLSLLSGSAAVRLSSSVSRFQNMLRMISSIYGHTNVPNRNMGSVRPTS